MDDVGNEQAEQASQCTAAMGYSLGTDDFYIRQTALNQACHDDKGQAPIGETLERARKYFDYLKNG